MSEPPARVRRGQIGEEDRPIGAVGRARLLEEVPGMERDKMLDVTLSQIERQFGKGAVMRLGEHPMGAGVSVIPTGSLALDVALGIGGIPPGRGAAGFGPHGSGRTPASPPPLPPAP